MPVSPALLMDEPRGYDQTTEARPLALHSAIISRHCWYMVWAWVEPG